MTYKSGRGSVGRAFRVQKRYQNSRGYREKCLQRGKIYCQRPEVKKQKREYRRNRTRILSEFANKRCKECNNIIYYKSKTDFCRRCYCHLSHKQRRAIKRRRNNKKDENKR